MAYFRYVLMHKSVLSLLLVVNALGTAYGFYWYRDQLAVTPGYFWPFVPDSPTASLFFCIVLLMFILKRNAPWIEALAVCSLFKYGVWAVVMNIWCGLTGYALVFGNYMLMVSHACMALEGLVYAPFYKIKMPHLALAGIWLLHNEIVDYVFHMMPWYGPLQSYLPIVGYFTFWLSVLTIGIVYRLCVKRLPAS